MGLLFRRHTRAGGFAPLFLPHRESFGKEKDSIHCAQLHISWPSRERAGFTLIELLVVISIIGLLSSVILTSINSARAKARDARRLRERNELIKALNFAYGDTNQWPESAGGGTDWSCLAPGAKTCWKGVSQGSDTLVASLAPYLAVLPKPNAPGDTFASNSYLFVSAHPGWTDIKGIHPAGAYLLWYQENDPQSRCDIKDSYHYDAFYYCYELLEAKSFAAGGGGVAAGGGEAGGVGGSGDAYTTLLLHADGPNAATSFADSSKSGHVPTVFGNAQLSTAKQKFGSASAYFDGSASYLRYADHADWQFGADNFTIDFWVYRDGRMDLNDATPGMALSYTRTTDAPPYGWWLHTDDSGTSFRVAVFVPDRGVSMNSGSIPNQAWTHIALVRNAGTLAIYQNGLLRQSAAITGAVNTGAFELHIGHDVRYPGTRYFFGHLDEIRISKGVARWSGNFSPPSGPYISQGAGPSTRLMGYWSFDEGTGNAVADTSGNGKNGSIGNAAWESACISGMCLRFSGSAPGVAVNNFTMPQTGTVSFWLKSDTAAWNTSAQPMTAGGTGFWMHSVTGTGLELFIGGTQVGTITLPVVLNAWNHYAWVVDRATSVFYVNGNPISTINTTQRWQATDTTLNIGWEGSGRTFAGLIDEVRIYNTPLTRQEIQNLFNTGAASNPLVSVSGRDTQRIADLGAIRAALEQYFQANGHYPQSDCGWDCNGYWFSFRASWDALANDLRPYLATLPKDPLNSGGCGPWDAGCLTYAYGNVGRNSQRLQYDLTAHLEDTSNPNRCGVKGYRWGFGNSFWCTAFGGSYDNQIYEASPN